MKTPQFWLLFSTSTMLCTGGMGLMSVAKPMISEVFSSSMPSIVTASFASSYLLVRYFQFHTKKYLINHYIIFYHYFFRHWLAATLVEDFFGQLFPTKLAKKPLSIASLLVWRQFLLPCPIALTRL